MKIDRAIEILNPEHREHYDGMDEVNEACRMGMEALERGRNAVPVVRCRDCEYLVNAAVNANGFLICGVSDMEITPEDFCSHGERRKSNENHA
jgi:hypothetical protein